MAFQRPTGTHIGQLTLSKDRPLDSQKVKPSGGNQCSPDRRNLGRQHSIRKGPSMVDRQGARSRTVSLAIGDLRYDEFDRPRIIELTQG